MSLPRFHKHHVGVVWRSGCGRVRVEVVMRNSEHKLEK